MTDRSTPSADQLSYVAGIQRRLHLPDALLDNHCVGRFGRPLAELTRREVSELLDEMTTWEQLPAALQRAKGQQDLPGFSL